MLWAGRFLSFLITNHCLALNFAINLAHIALFIASHVPTIIVPFTSRPTLDSHPSSDAPLAAKVPISRVVGEPCARG